MANPSNSRERPKLSVEERLVRDHIKRARKLRWIGAVRSDGCSEREQPYPALATIFAANFTGKTHFDGE